MRALFLSFLTILMFPTHSAFALSPQEEVIERATIALKSMLGNEENQEIRKTLPEAKAIIIVPRMLQAGFIIGGNTGDGLMIKRKGNSWSAPAFYNLSGASIGIQIGGQSSEVVFTIMNDETVRSLTEKRSMKLGTDIAMAIGGTGKGTGQNISSDIITFSQAQGLYGGISFEGGAVSVKDDWNTEFYNQEISAEEILYGSNVTAPASMTEIYRLLP